MSKKSKTTNLEAERSVLGSMLRDNSRIGDVVQIVRVDDFYVFAHQRVFAAIIALWDANKPVDLVTVAELLMQRDELKELGEGGRGAVYLAELLDAEPTGANVAYYARIVRDKALLRALVRVAGHIAETASNCSGSAQEILNAAEQEIFALAQHGVRGTAIDIATAVQRTRECIEARARRGKGGGLQTGFVELDDLTGGLHDGELVLVAARPSIGKTSLGLALMVNVALEQQQPVYFASLEQSVTEVVERMACAVGRVNSHSLRSGRPDAAELAAADEALEALAKSPMVLDDCPAQSMLHIASNARRLKAQGKLRLVVVDYLQLIDPDNRREKRHEQVGAISRRLKQLARELQVPVVALAQLNRELEHRQNQTPKLADLRDSGELEQNADTVMLLHKPADMEDALDVIIAKQRNGPIGTVQLAFERKCYRFGNLVPDLPT